MTLSVSGQLAGIRTSSYQGKDKVYLQFLERKPDGSVGFMEVKVPEGMSATKYRQGENVTIPVEYNLVRDKIYWAIVKESSATGTAPKL